MRLENSFEVAAPVDAAWRLLNDVPAVLPCMPGAELVETIGENAWKAKLRVKLGPISLQFLADVSREEIDEQSGHVVLVTRAREAKGRGSAEARIESAVTRSETGARVVFVTDIELRGAVAQYGRGVVAGVASTMTRQFAECLSKRLSEEASRDLPIAADETKLGKDAAAQIPVKGVRRTISSFIRSLRNLRRNLRRLS